MAIAFDALTSFNITGTAATKSVTVTGSNLVLFVVFRNNTDTSDVVTSVTYNGVAMTLLHKLSSIGNATDFGYLYFLTNPSTGANNLVINSSSSKNYVGEAVSWAGVTQTGQPEASNYVDSNTTDAPSTSVTTITDNAWTLLFCVGADGVGSAGTGSTARSGTNCGVYDSNAGIHPAGSNSMSVSGLGTRTHSELMVAIAPITVSIEEEGFLSRPNYFVPREMGKMDIITL